MRGVIRPDPDSLAPAAAALAYAASGWSVVPVHVAHEGRCSCGRADCNAPGKHPRLRWEEAQHHPADPTQVARWWRRWPDANVGVVTGRVSALAVIDIDPRHGGDAAFEDLQAGWGGPVETVTSATGGGGRHLWFRTSDPPASTVLAEGVELKAEGGMVVAPPSLHLSGHRYRWEPGRSPSVRPPAPLPGWLRAIAGDGFRPGRRPKDAPVRTRAEQEAFVAAWRRAGVELHPGDNYYLCPFHDDHHPSLHVDAEGCRWYCFACRDGGGIGRLREKLGETRPVRLRRRIRGFAGPRRPVTLPGDRPVSVVGESAHQDELLELTGGRRSYAGVEMEAVAELVPTDDGTIEVRIGGRTVGVLARDDAATLRPLVEEAIDSLGAATCRAEIRGGWDRGGGDVGLFGVELLCP